MLLAEIEINDRKLLYKDIKYYLCPKI
jgi:hypothetical protein